MFRPVPGLAVVCFWICLMWLRDVVFVALALWTFDPVMKD